MKRQAKEVAQQWLKYFSPESPLVDALVDVTPIAHGAGALERARQSLAVMRCA